MIKVTREIDDTLDLTVYSVQGEIGLDLIFELIDQFYQSPHTLNLAWDLSEADLSKMTIKEIQRIQNYARKYSHLRKNGKTAFIMATDVNFGLGRMYETVAEIDNHHITHCVFKQLDEAKKWFEK